MDNLDQRSLVPLQRELERLGAEDVQLSLDSEFEPEAGTLVKVEIGEAFWHLASQDLKAIIADLPDGAGSEAIKQEIETEATQVWHGPEPKQNRDSAP